MKLSRPCERNAAIQQQRKSWIASSLIVLAMTVAGCTPQPAISPGKIVSNNPCLDAILAEVSDPAEIGAVSRWSQDADSASAPLAWARRFPAVGDSAEEIILARPRLVLSGNLASSGTNAALAKAGIRVVPLGVPATIAESVQQVRDVAAAIGRPAAGEHLVARMEAALQTASQTGLEQGKGALPTALIWQAGGFVAGAGTVQDEMLARAGFRNASTAYGLRQWDVLPVEVMIQSPPDVIFMPVKTGGEEGRAIAMREGLAARLNGHTRIIPFPDRLLFCAGPTMVEAMRVLTAARWQVPA